MIGVFWSSSNLSVALYGPADGKPAEGNPDRMGSRKADDRDTADSGVLSEIAEGREMADLSSEADGGL